METLSPSVSMSDHLDCCKDGKLPGNYPLPDDMILGSGELCRHLIADRRTLNLAAEIFPLRISPQFSRLIHSPDDPIGRQLIPTGKELDHMDRSADPLEEETHSPVPQIIHRYPFRVVFLVSTRCAVHCRFCLRKRNVGADRVISEENIVRSLDYIRSQTQINEVILTGGDPLMLNDWLLLHILSALRQIRHVKLLRIHTRVPGALPQRITPDLAKKLSAFHPLYINIHFNHPAEITSQSAAACALLADAGIPLGSQTVLLRGINDNPGTLSRLMQELLTIRVRPYYIHQLDRMPGTAHFQVPLDEAVDLISTLRGPLSGVGVPHFMVDLPGGGGKVALCAQNVVRKEDKRWILRNWEGKLFTYEWD